MQSTTYFHHYIANVISSQAYPPCDNCTAFDTTDNVLNPHTPSCNQPVFDLLIFGQLAAFGLLVWDSYPHTIEREAQKTEILDQFAACGQWIKCHVSQRFVMHPTLNCVAQKLNACQAIHEHVVLDRVALFLAAIVVRLFRRVLGARDGSLGAIVKKGEAALSSGVSRPSC